MMFLVHHKGADQVIIQNLGLELYFNIEKQIEKLEHRRECEAKMLIENSLWLHPELSNRSYFKGW